MTYSADLHLHSPYARGTSRHLTLENMAGWAKLKGIDLLASGDFTHPLRFEETRRKLRETSDGLLELDGVGFVLGSEVACTAEQGGRNRRVHMLIYAPSLDAAAAVNEALAPLGSLTSDGRPVLHTSPRELWSVLVSVDSRCFVIPAHLWTPWFGLYGSKSGFDSLEECFGDAASEIHAVETGLSSDPAMNWRVPSLDRVSIVSFSDAHSLAKMGRELTFFPGQPSYDGLLRSLKTQDLEYTVEFFPEEGKYHHSGHRRCQVSLTPAEIRKRGERCPACGRPLTLGVLQRVEELACRSVETWVDDDGFVASSNGRTRFKTLVGLQQIIAEAMRRGTATKGVKAAYLELVKEVGSELDVLMHAPVSDIERVSGERIAEGVDRMRTGQLAIEPGYDGLYGTVTIWPDEEAKSGRSQPRLPLSRE